MTRNGRRQWIAAVTATAAITSGGARAAESLAVAAPQAGTSTPAIEVERSPAQAPTQPQFSLDEELLLEVRTDEYIITDALTGFARPNGVYLPLGELARALDLAIAVDAEAGRAEGWILAEERIFRLDIAQRTVELASGQRAIQGADVAAFEGEIYVRAQVLADWFPLKIEARLAQQQVKLELLETFPFEARIDRANARVGLTGPRSNAVEYEREETPYLLASPPALDVNLRGSTGLNSASSGQFDVRGAIDLFYMNADIFLAGDDTDALSGARLAMRRRDPDRTLLGPLHLSLVEVGDTASLSLPLGVNSRTGRGLVFGNLPADRSSVFDRIDLRGELPLGFEAELYRNDILIGSVDRPVEGRYEFLQVPLEYGLNVLRIVFYGPRGERREEVRRINAGQGRLGRGEFQFLASAVQQDTSLFGIESDRGALGPPRPGEGAWRGAAFAEYGLSPAITLAGGLASFVPNSGIRRNQALLGVRTGIGSAAAQLDGAIQDGGAWATQLGLAGRALGASYVAQHIEYGRGFLDETRSSGSNDFRRATLVRLDTILPIGQRVIATNLVAERAQSANRTEWSAGLRTSTSVSSWLVSNRLAYRQSNTRDSVSRGLDGGVEANGSIAGWGARAGLAYDVIPRFNLRDFSMTFDRELDHALLLRVGISQQLSRGFDTRAGVSISKQFRRFDLSSDVQYDTGSKALLIGMRVAFSLGFDRRRGVAVTRPGLARGGSLAALAFRDTNANGIRDPGEAPVEGLRFRGGASEARTDARGEALVTGLGDGRIAQVTLDPSSFDDPYLTPRRQGVAIVPRPGRVHFTSFPIVAMSEVEGEVLFESEGGARAVANVQLQLVDAAGAVVSSTRTEYDGFFLFEKVPAGQYTVRLDPVQADQLRIEAKEQPVIEAEADGGLVGSIRLLLRKATDQR